MNKDLILNIILCIIITILLSIYMIYILIDERKKIKYYKSSITYETDWDKYNTMYKKQKRIILKKKIQLLILKVLVFLKRMITWN